MRAWRLGRGADHIKAWETWKATSLRLGVRHLVISGSRQSANQTTQPERNGGRGACWGTDRRQTDREKAMTVLTDTEVPPGPGPGSHGLFSPRKCQWETGSLRENKVSHYSRFPELYFSSQITVESPCSGESSKTTVLICRDLLAHC